MRVHSRVLCGAQSTLFNALCENGKAEAANYPFCTIEANSGVVAVPDDRLEVFLRICPLSVPAVSNCVRRQGRCGMPHCWLVTVPENR